MDERTNINGVSITALNQLWRAAFALPLDDPAPASDSDLWGVYPYQIVDLRESTAFLAGHLPEACSLPGSEIENRVSELPPKWRPTIFVSDKPRLAKKTAADLTSRGWRHAIALLDSINKWNGPLQEGPAVRFAWEPTPVVRQWVHCLRPGRVLDLGCGAGRDAVYLARRGGEVTAVDLLPDALALAEQLAQRSGLYLATRLMDLRKVHPPADEGYDTILMLRFLERALFPFLVTALRPGGILLLETFCHDPDSDKQIRPSRRLASQEALRQFTSGSQPLHILEYREYRDQSGKFVARLVGKKE
jgi:tellurite methyltransferase